MYNSIVTSEHSTLKNYVIQTLRNFCKNFLTKNRTTHDRKIIVGSTAYSQLVQHSIGVKVNISLLQAMEAHTVARG
jgi:HD superfamily phosphohydrolase YqeK